MMTVLDLFSGIGGFSLGLEWAGGFETKGFCECDDFCRRVLRKHWPDVTIIEDIKDLRGDEFGPVDLVCGGPPCQPASVAGQRRGTEDDRWLWPEVFRVVAAVKPAWCLFENPAGIGSLGFNGVQLGVESRTGGRTPDGADYLSVALRQEDLHLGAICEQLAALGYEVAVLAIPACAVDAPHLRQRLWIVAHATEPRCAPRAPGTDRAVRNDGKAARRARFDGLGDGRSVAHAESERPLQPAFGAAAAEPDGDRPEQWLFERDRGSGVADAERPRPQERAGERGDDGAQRQTAERGRGMGDATSFGHRGGANAEQQRRQSERERIVRGEHERSGGSHWRDADWLWCEFDQCWRRVPLPGLRGLAPRLSPGMARPVTLLANGVPERVAKLRALGNAVVPQIVEQIGRAILEQEEVRT